MLKDNRPDLLRDARSLMETIPPASLARGRRQCLCWDIEGFTSWPDVKVPVRNIFLAFYRRNLKPAAPPRRQHGAYRPPSGLGTVRGRVAGRAPLTGSGRFPAHRLVAPPSPCLNHFGHSRSPPAPRPRTPCEPAQGRILA